jgi:hypothetical protein
MFASRQSNDGEAQRTVRFVHCADRFHPRRVFFKS